MTGSNSGWTHLVKTIPLPKLSIRVNDQLAFLEFAVGVQMHQISVHRPLAMVVWDRDSFIIPISQERKPRLRGREALPRAHDECAVELGTEAGFPEFAPRSSRSVVTRGMWPPVPSTLSLFPSHVSWYWQFSFVLNYTYTVEHTPDSHSQSCRERGNTILP